MSALLIINMSMRLNRKSLWLVFVDRMLSETLAECRRNTQSELAPKQVLFCFGGLEKLILYKAWDSLTEHC